jgi:hypothetical protein
MPPFQKTLIVTVVAVALGTAIYQAHEASGLRHQVDVLLQQQASLTNHIAELEATTATTRKQLAKTRENNTRLITEMHELSKKNSARIASAKKDDKPKGFAALFGGNGTNGMSGMMDKVMKNAMQQQVDGKLAAMKAKLNLTADQEAAIHDILAKQADKGAAMVQKMFNGNGINTNDIAQASENLPSEQAQIKALLTPDQATAYDALQKEESANNVRLMANMELMQIQPMLQLNQDQQDKVFTVLAQQGQANADQAQTDPGAASDFQGQMDRKAQALSSVLTPDQLASYQKFQQQQLSIIEAIKH